jgi:hypothetical protein
MRIAKKVALGVEISEDRAHPSIVGAGYVNKSQGVVLVDLLAYLTGTDATSTVLRLCKTRTVRSVFIDPHSPGATLIRPLTDAEVIVTQPSTSDIAVAPRLVPRRARGRAVAARGASRNSTRRFGMAHNDPSAAPRHGNDAARQ